ncbi:nicotinamide riboside transporter PnuC [Dactylosporangium sp. NPDC000244]|uniref:nicotinamide riboside transporter PnuC n=1 Tax=Dactylosporangium sp. NPDC000244 TaxID=3154365 RepID=UPI00331EBE1F
MLDWLTSAALHAFGAPTTWAELLGFASGLLCVYLVVRQHIANWPVGIANNLLFIVAFWHVGLFGDAWLQVVYVALGAYGWWCWSTGRLQQRVRTTTRAEWWWLAAAGVLLSVALWWYLDRFTESTVPWPDALTTAVSLLATYGQTRRLVESWWLWISVDVVYIPLYGYKDLWLTALLYLVFLTLCVFGLRAWRAELRRAPERSPAWSTD